MSKRHSDVKSLRERSEPCDPRGCNHTGRCSSGYLQAGAPMDRYPVVLRRCEGPAPGRYDCVAPPGSTARRSELHCDPRQTSWAPQWPLLVIAIGQRRSLASTARVKAATGERVAAQPLVRYQWARPTVADATMYAIDADLNYVVKSYALRTIVGYQYTNLGNGIAGNSIHVGLQLMSP